MEQEKQNSDDVLIENTLVYLRDCHGHLHSLTRTVVSLNVAILAFGVLFLKLSDGFNSTASDFVGIVLVVFGVLIALFGVVFNLGAQKAFQYLVAVIDDAKIFLEEVISDSSTASLFFNKVLKNKRGLVFRLTNQFFYLCSFIWVFYGGTLLVYGILMVLCEQG